MNDAFWNAALQWGLPGLGALLGGYALWYTARADANRKVKEQQGKETDDAYCRLLKYCDRQQCQIDNQEKRISACEEDRAEQGIKLARLEGRVTKVENGHDKA